MKARKSSENKKIARYVAARTTNTDLRNKSGNAQQAQRPDTQKQMGLPQTVSGNLFTPIFGFSLLHDFALKLCINSQKPCPTGCVKNGAANCYAHVMNIDNVGFCEFGKIANEK